MKDTGAWIFQTWAAAVISAMTSLYGIWVLKDQNNQNFLLMIMGFFFCVFAAITLQKMIRDNQEKAQDTASYRITTWSAFVISLTLTGYCLRSVELEHWHRAQLITSFLFVISSVFVLTKTLRDNA